MKRFTETTKWRDPWFRRLSPIAKLLWLYLIDNCSCIGLIEIDPDAAEFDIGHKIGEKHLTELGDRIQALEDGKYFIPKFIRFQYGELSETCPAHKPVFKAISQHQLIRDSIDYKYPKARVDTTLQERKGMDKEKEEGVQGEIKPVLCNTEHQAFIKGWSENFKAQFGFDYDFDGSRDGKAVKELLSKGILRLDLLEIAKNAWKRSDVVKSFNCGQAATIHGFKAYINQIRTELSHEPGLTGKINPRLVGVSRNNAVNNYAEAAKRKIEQQNMARQVAGSGNLPSSEAKGTGGRGPGVLPGIMEQP